jgi:hypothetical protein
MPHYKLTGYHSHRHPFLGSDAHTMVSVAGPGDEGNLIDLDNPFAPGIYEALAADEPQPVSVGKVARPFVYGAVSGLVVYGIARQYATPKAAKQIGLVFGGASVLLGFATDFVYREMQALVEAKTKKGA